MNDNIVVKVEQYDRIDGRNAYRSNIKQLTMGLPQEEANKSMPIVATIWNEDEKGELSALAELPIHQVLDLAILACRTLVYFGEAYRYPMLYNPDDPSVELIGLQGGVMPVSICTDNSDIHKDIQDFSQGINDLGELTGERLRVLYRLLEEMGY